MEYFHIFYGCKSLKLLPDISKWNTSKVTDMSWMFYQCSSLENLSDVSKWNIDNVSVMSHMFNNCKVLKNLSDISIWNTKNVKDFVVKLLRVYQICQNGKFKIIFLTIAIFPFIFLQN